MTAPKSEPRPENTIWDRDLITAAKGGHINLAKEELKNGAFIDCYDKNFYTPLMLAAGNNHYAIAKLLIDSGADVTWKTPSGATPYSVAVENDAEEDLFLISQEDLISRKIYNKTELREMLENWVTTTWHTKNLKLMPTGTYVYSEVEAAYQALVFFAKKLGVLKE